jgi:hypothetical protein
LVRNLALSSRLGAVESETEEELAVIHSGFELPLVREPSGKHGSFAESAELQSALARNRLLQLFGHGLDYNLPYAGALDYNGQTFKYSMATSQLRSKVGNDARSAFNRKPPEDRFSLLRS